MNSELFETLKDNVGQLVSVVANECLRKKVRSGANSLNEGETTVVTVYGCFVEVRMGGFASYFQQQYRWTTGNCVAALERVGLSEFAEIVETAISRCRNNGNRGDDSDEAKDCFMLREEFFNVGFDDLESEFYQLGFANKHLWQQKLHAYILQESDLFVELR